MKQTAVEWLLESSHIVPKNELNKRELIEQAKEMEKQQQDNFAIKFTDWCEDFYYPSSAKSIWYDKPDFSVAKKFTTIELLEIYKNK